MSVAALGRMVKFPHALFAGTQRKQASDVVTLGKTGIKVSRLLQGTGTNGVGRSSDQIRSLGSLQKRRNIRGVV